MFRSEEARQKLKRYWRAFTIVIAITIPLIFIALYFYVAPRFNPGLVNQILFHPGKIAEHGSDMKVLSNVQAEDVSIKSGDATINALFYKLPDAPDVILLSHGNAGNLDHRIDKIKAMLDSGVSVLAYDYKGYGKSGGEPSVPGIVEDGIAAYDYLVKQKGYTPQNIVLYGESVGTGVTTEVARQRECKAIILESGFTSPERRAKEKIPPLNAYPGFLMLYPTLDNLDYVKGKHPPLMLYAGKLDDMIPPHHTEEMFAAASEPKRVVYGPNSTHNDFSKDFALYKSTLAEFLKANATVAGKAAEQD